MTKVRNSPRLHKASSGWRNDDSGVDPYPQIRDLTSLNPLNQKGRMDAPGLDQLQVTLDRLRPKLTAEQVIIQTFGAQPDWVERNHLGEMVNSSSKLRAGDLLLTWAGEPAYLVTRPGTRYGDSYVYFMPLGEFGDALCQLHLSYGLFNRGYGWVIRHVGPRVPEPATETLFQKIWRVSHKLKV